MERILAHWRKLAGASHIGIGCHVDPAPAKPFSSLVQTASPEHAYRPDLKQCIRYVLHNFMLIILWTVRVDPAIARDALLTFSKKPNGKSTRQSPTIAQGRIKLQDSLWTATCVQEDR